jgi:hypothetical protein
LKAAYPYADRRGGDLVFSNSLHRHVHENMIWRKNILDLPRDEVKAPRDANSFSDAR